MLFTAYKFMKNEYFLCVTFSLLTLWFKMFFLAKHYFGTVLNHSDDSVEPKPEVLVAEFSARNIYLPSRVRKKFNSI